MYGGDSNILFKADVDRINFLTPDDNYSCTFGAKPTISIDKICIGGQKAQSFHVFQSRYILALEIRDTVLANFLHLHHDMTKVVSNQKSNTQEKLTNMVYSQKVQSDIV